MLTPDGPLVVVGDALLDVDVVGHACRLAPDAPVPVVDVEHESVRPGGAGLAAVLAARSATGGGVVLVAPVAADPAGERLAGLLAEAGVDLVAVPRGGRTVVKRRVLAPDRPVVRIDEGEPGPIGPLPPTVADALADAATVLVSDYGGGATGDPALREALGGVRAPVVWDPHPRGAAPVPEVALATPNEAEARVLTDGLVDGSAAGLADVAARAAALVRHWGARGVAVTLGHRGALLSRGEDPPVVVPPRWPAADRDSCGAGDCFAASAALAVASGALVPEAVEAGVRAATRFVHDGGAAALDRRTGAQGPPNRHPGTAEPAQRDRRGGAEGPAPGDLRVASEVIERVRAEGGTVVATGGCFDLIHAGHVETLRAARALGDCLVVLLNSDESVRRLKGPDRPLVHQADRARVLAALDAVDAVAVFDEQTPVAALRRLRPDVWAKGGDYSGQQLPEAAVLREWGGQAVVLPYLDGRSTSRLVAEARASAGY